MKYDNQLRYASDIVRKYDGRVPLSPWLKDFFRVNKQMGSRDRKTVSEMVYGFYRLGGLQFDSVEERILSFIGITDNLPEVKDYFFSDNKNSLLSNGAKVTADKIFPFEKYLCEEIDAEEFSKSFLVQPDLYLRIRPQQKENVVGKLSTNNIKFQECGDDCIALPNATKIETVLDINREAVIQDRSSQQTGLFIREVEKSIPHNVSVWDCCAASGGKSIMAHDILKESKLTVSDIRQSIIQNLINRFSEAGIDSYTSFVADLTDLSTKISPAAFDLVIADVPCSGSGTWARTPEQMYFFKEDKISFYSNLQKKIISRVVPAIKENGFLLYITCSVFAEENEKVADHISREHNLKFIKSELISGYRQKADTLYAALFTNRST